MTYAIMIRTAAAAAAILAGALSFAAPAAAQYGNRGYYETPDYEPEYRPRRRYSGEYGGREYGRGYGREYGRGYGERGGYVPQRGGYYVDKETAKRNIRDLKEQQKRAIKGGYYNQSQPQIQPRYAPQTQQGYGGQPTYQAPRVGVGRVIGGPTVGAETSQRELNRQ